MSRLSVVSGVNARLEDIMAVAGAVVKATPNPLPTSKAQLLDLHSLSRLAMVKVKDMVKIMVMVTVMVTDSPSTTS
jgi:hypothetical protein